VVACVGGGSNAAGTFAGFVDTTARLIGVEAAGGAAMTGGAPGVVHGARSMVLQDAEGQVAEAESIAAGLDYPGIGPEHAHLGAIGRAEYRSVTDAEVVAERLPVRLGVRFERDRRAVVEVGGEDPAGHRPARTRRSRSGRRAGARCAPRSGSPRVADRGKTGRTFRRFLCRSVIRCNY